MVAFYEVVVVLFQARNEVGSLVGKLHLNGTGVVHIFGAAPRHQNRQIVGGILVEYACACAATE
ncbi:MAG TPA: hypothetical protein EYN66_22515 [Myxococcales bacterium]|nr:hypothetical protein [Myxococcales bacterium]